MVAPSADDGILPDAWLGTTDNEWAYEAWDAMLVALDSGAPPMEEAERLIQVDLQLLDHIDLGRWLSRPAVQLRADTSGPALSAVLVHLCARGALSVPAVLETFVYSCWADFTASTLFRALVLAADVRVVSTAASGSLTLLNAGLRMARTCVFSDEYFPALLAGLMRLHNVGKDSEELPEQQVDAASLLHAATRSSDFLAVVFRILGRHHHQLSLGTKLTGHSLVMDALGRATSLLLPLTREHYSKIEAARTHTARSS